MDYALAIDQVERMLLERKFEQRGHDDMQPRLQSQTLRRLNDRQVEVDRKNFGSPQNVLQRERFTTQPYADVQHRPQRPADAREPWQPNLFVERSEFFVRIEK